MAEFKVDQNKQTPYDETFREMEQKYGLPDGLLKTTALIENRNNIQNRVSPKGASGVMQIMPANYQSLGITDANDPRQSIEGAARLYSQLNTQYSGDVGAMMAHYNGGNKSGSRYQEGKSLNPETADYIKYATPYLTSVGKPSKYGQSIETAGVEQVQGQAPSDLPLSDDTENPAQFTESLETKFEKQLQEESQFFNLSMDDALKQGFRSTMTDAISHMASREQDDDFQLGESHFERVKQLFPGGLDEGTTQRIYNARSESDFDYVVGRVREEQDFGRRLGLQSGGSKYAGYAALFAGSMADPAALPLGSFGVAGRIIKGSTVAAGAGRAALEGVAATAIASPVIQQIEKGHVDANELFTNLAAGAIMGGAIGAAGSKFAGQKLWAKESDEAIVRRFDEAPPAAPKPEAAAPEGEVVNFRNATDTTVADDGAIVGIGATEVNRAAAAWDESVTPDMQRVLDRRAKWYGSEARQKLMGWSDSEGVKLGASKNKVARFVGAMWAGNSAGIGKAEARTAATLKDQLKEQLDYTYIPAMKEHFESFMTAAEKYDYIGGGAKGAQERFSREVQLERYRLREYKISNENSAKGYQTEAPAAVQRAAKLMDDMYTDTKAMHMQAQTEHAAQLKDSDPVGYIEQRPDFNKLQAADMETRKAFLSMVKDDYQAEAGAKLNKLRAEKPEWIEKTYARANEATAEGATAPKWVDDFLANPDAYFDKHFNALSKRIRTQMDKRAGHWWDNALKDPELRYQNSEASLMTLAREMSSEWFTGREVDADLVKSFQKALTEKWADTSRRELRMTNKRTVGGQDVYLLDMFQHDVFGNMTNNIADTSGRVAMAKMGWKTEQDILDTLQAMANSGAAPREIEAAKHISDILLNRAKGLDNSPLVQSVSNLTHAAMMGKLGFSVFADLPTIIGNLGVGGMTRALGDMAAQAINGELFVKAGRKTKLGNDLDANLTGLLGHDHELWIPQAINGDGHAIEMAGGLLKRSQAAARFTNTVSFANAMSRSMGTAVTRTTTKALHKLMKTGKGITPNRLADVGLHDKELARVKAQFDKYAGKEDFGLDKWDDPYAKEVFVSAAHKFTNQNRIDHQSAGELPKWTKDNMLGALYGRFRTIGIRAQEKILMRNLTMADANTLGMLTTALAWTTFLAYARIHMDAATSKDGNKVLEERLTPLGVASQVAKLASVTGLASEGLGFLELITGGGVQSGSDTPLTGAIGNITGAIGKTGEAVTGSGDWSSAGSAAFKLLPGANSYLLMGLKKSMED